MSRKKKELPPTPSAFAKPVQLKMGQYTHFLSIIRELQFNMGGLQKQLAYLDAANQQRVQQEIQMLETQRREFRERLRETANSLPPNARRWLARKLSNREKKLE